MKKVFGFLCLFLCFITFSCVNLISNQSSSFSITLGDSVQSSISRTSSFDTQTSLKVDGLLLKNDLVALKESTTTTLGNIKDITFIFKDLPFSNDYKVEVNIYFEEHLLYQAKTDLLEITEDNDKLDLDLTVSPVYKNIQYELNGGSFTSTFPTKYFINRNITLHNPTKAGATFLGWYLNKECSGNKIEQLGKDNFLGDVTLYAKWSTNSYTISYEDGNGKIIDTKPFDYGYTLTSAELTPLNKENHDFAGWTLDGNVIKEGYTLTHDITLIPSWTLWNKVSNIVISPNVTELDYNENIALSCSTPGAQIYYTLDGSDPLTSDKKTLYTQEIVVDGDKNIRAIAIKDHMLNSDESTKTINMKTYTITFNNGGYGTLNRQSIPGLKKDDTLPPDSLTPLTETGHTFKHWQDSDGTLVDKNYKVSKTTTVTAVWDINRYNITYVTGTTESIPVKTVDYNYSLTSSDLRTDLTNEHHDFEGWFIDTQKIDVGYKVTNNITLTAHWKLWDQVSTVTITPDVTELDYNETISLNCSTPGAQIYYTLDGSDPISGTPYSTSIPVTGNMNIRAIAKNTHMLDSEETAKTINMKTYTITYDIGGIGQPVSQDTGLKRGDTFQITKTTTDVNNKFLGWQLGGSVVTSIPNVIKDETLVAKWSNTGDLDITIQNFDSLATYSYTVKNQGTVYNSLQDVSIQSASFTISGLKYNTPYTLEIKGDNSGNFTSSKTLEVTLSSTDDTLNSKQFNVDAENGYVKVSAPKATLSTSNTLTVNLKSGGSVVKSAVLQSNTQTITISKVPAGRYDIECIGVNTNETYKASTIDVTNGAEKQLVVNVDPNNVYFVKENAPTGGNGVEAAPFATLKDAVSKGGVITIYVEGTINEPDPLGFGNQTIISKNPSQPATLNLCITGSNNHSYTGDNVKTIFDNIIVNGGDFPNEEHGTIVVNQDSTLKLRNGASVRSKSGSSIILINQSTTVVLDDCGEIKGPIYSKYDGNVTIENKKPRSKVQLQYTSPTDYTQIPAIKGLVNQDVANMFEMVGNPPKQLDSLGKVIK